MTKPYSFDDRQVPEITGSSEQATGGSVRLEPVTPDRRRIDSDVRCFLRQPSTPWIVFGGDDAGAAAPGEPDAIAMDTPAHPHERALSAIDIVIDVSALLTPPPQASPLVPSAELATHQAPPAPDTLRPLVTPLATASPIGPTSGAFEEPRADVGPDARIRRERRLVPIVGGALVVLSAVAGIALAVTAGEADGARMSAAMSSPASLASPAEPAEAVEPASAPAPTTTLDRPASPPAASPEAVAAAPTSVSADESKAGASKAAPKRLGRLTIAGAARHKHVYMDGKRLLGRGKRSFTVYCGTHEIAVGERSDTREMDVPCNAELVVSR